MLGPVYRNHNQQKKLQPSEDRLRIKFLSLHHRKNFDRLHRPSGCTEFGIPKKTKRHSAWNQSMSLGRFFGHISMFAKDSGYANVKLFFDQHLN